MELNSIVIYHLGEELRGRKRQTSVQMSAEVDSLALVWVGDGFTRAAPLVAGTEEPFCLHVLELLIVEYAGDPDPAEAFLLRRRFCRRRRRCCRQAGRGRRSHFSGEQLT